MEQQEIPIKLTILKSLEMVKENSFELIRLGAPLILVTLFSSLYYHLAEIEQSDSVLSFENIIIGMVYLFALANAVIGAHRIFLLPQQDILSTKAIRWTMRETRFSAWWFVVSLCAGLCAIPISLIFMPFSSELIENEYMHYLFSMFIALPIGYLICRWSLIFPATAIDQKNKGLAWSWELSKGHSLRLFLLIFCIPLTTDIILSILPNSDNILMQIFYQAIWFIIGAIEICLLSLSYQLLSKWHSENSLKPTEC